MALTPEVVQELGLGLGLELLLSLEMVVELGLGLANSMFFLFNPHQMTCLLIFRERGREGKKEGEKH